MNTAERNEFRVKGRILNQREGQAKDSLIITLVVKNSYRDIHPEIRCKKSMMPEHKEHAVLEIRGYIAKDTHNIPRLYATDVKLADPILDKEFGVKGRFWEPEDCYYYVTGEVADVKEDNVGKAVYVRYVIQTKKPETNEPTEVKIDWKKIDRHPEFNPGDRICAVCKINTPSKNIGSEERHFMNLDVFDMAMLE